MEMLLCLLYPEVTIQKQQIEKIWKTVRKLQEDLSDLKVRIKKHSSDGLLPKWQAWSFLKDIRDLENILQKKVVDLLQKAQPTIPYLEYERVVKTCKDALGYTFQIFKEIDQKMIIAIGGNMKGSKSTSMYDKILLLSYLIYV